jgi:hypothetical protein
MSRWACAHEQLYEHVLIHSCRTSRWACAHDRSSYAWACAHPLIAQNCIRYDTLKIQKNFDSSVGRATDRTRLGGFFSKKCTYSTYWMYNNVWRQIKKNVRTGRTVWCHRSMWRQTRIECTYNAVRTVRTVGTPYPHLVVIQLITMFWSYHSNGPAALIIRH